MATGAHSVPPLLAIVGPTASGKTALALAIARRIPVEILVADSRQVYRGMDIGTAKPDVDARAAVPHHLLDLATPDQPFTLHDWLRAARRAMSGVGERGRTPLLVGGTGLYVSALLDGYALGKQGRDPALRAALTSELERGGLAALAQRLAARDPDAAARVDLHNPRRVVRALERSMHGGGGEPNRSVPPVPVRIVGIGRPPEVLEHRIATRATWLFAHGLVAEVRALLDAGYGPDLEPMTGHGYREAARYLAGEWSLDEAIAVTTRRTRQYAKRQRTWFRRDPRIQWIDAGREEADAESVVDAALAVAKARSGPG